MFLLVFFLHSNNVNKCHPLDSIHKCSLLIQLRKLTIGVFPVLVPLLVLRQSVVSLGAHGLGQVTERLGVVQVEFLENNNITTVTKTGLIRKQASTFLVANTVNCH